MIQQVIGIDSWEDMHSLAIKQFQIPLFVNRFSLLLSNLNKESILPSLNQNPEKTSRIKSALNDIFSDIYLSHDTLVTSDFLIDLSRVTVRNDQHVVVLLDQNELTSKELELIITHSFSLFIQITVIIVNSDNSYIRNILFPFISSPTYYVGNITHLQDDIYSKMISYRAGNISLGNKVFKLNQSNSDYIQNEFLPTFIEESAASSSFVAAHNFHSFSFSQNVADELDRSQEAVVVFNCRGFHDISRVSKHVFSFKQKYGRNLKIIVKESVPCIRYNDFHMLLSAGAQAIVEHDRTDSILFDQIRLASHTTMDEGSLSFDSLSKYFQSPLSMSGIQSFDTFSRTTLDVVEAIKDSQLEFALVELIPFSSVLMDEVISYCQLKRKGDIAATHDGKFFIFFSSLRLYEVSQALTNVFSLSINDLFIEINTFVEPDKITHKLAPLSTTSSSRSSNDSPTPEPLSEPKTKTAKKVTWDSL
ncbi:BcsE family c-di-GMP-binding protein [Vibrio sp. 10N.261.51.F12]|uniref:BcsE family c-di-GMP-binding protein n=1 Tax=Vibrio sp. 10N.261.51.F12 TaxID=3229679 RepID=UPI003550F6F6